MASPEFRVEAGFDSNATDAVVKWTDVTPWFSELGSHRGRSTELDQIETGTATFAFDNADGRFTPGRSTLTALAERFNAFGVAGTDLFTFDSGEWLRSGPLAMSLTAGSTGVTVAATGAGLSDSVAIRLNSRGVPVVAGQLVTVSARVRVTCTSSLTNFKLRAQYDSAVARDVATDTGSLVTSDGAFVTFRQTFTVPAGATFIRPRVDGFPTSGTVGTLTMAVAWVRVEVPAPYAGKLDVRNPIRAYARFDDNYLHAESVNANLIDADQPRWASNDAAFPNGKSHVVKKVTDPVKGPVFDMSGWNPGGPIVLDGTFDSGIAGDVDLIHVKPGDVVTLDADVMSPGPGLVDNFTRTVSGSWGSTATGEAWNTYGAGGTVTAADFSVNGSKGVHSVPAKGAYRASYLSGVNVRDQDVTATFALPAVTAVTGDQLEPTLMLRVQGNPVTTGTYYMARARIQTSGSIIVELRKLVNNVDTLIGTPMVASGVTYSSGSAFKMRAQIITSATGQAVFSAKVWPAASFEPSSWTVAEIESAASIVAPGSVGIRSGVTTANTNTSPVAFQWDDLSVTDLQTSGKAGPASLRVLHASYVSSPAEVATVTGTAAPNVWEHLTVSYTVPTAGYVRLRLILPAGDAPRIRACNLKVRLNGVGSATVAKVSGVTPAFRGFVEKWSSVPSGQIGMSQATCVDTLSVTNQPLNTYYRSLGISAMTSGAQAPSYYWPCVEGDDATSTQPLVGDLPLRVVRTPTAPETGGFTSDKTFIYSDGEDSGGFKVEDANGSLGAVLVLANSSTPNLLNTRQFAVTMWVKLTALPGAGYMATLFRVSNTAGYGVIALEVLPSGAVQCTARTATNAINGQATTSAGRIIPGKAQFVTLSVEPTSLFLSNMNITVDGTFGSATASTITSFGGQNHSHIQFGGYIIGGLNTFFINGSINHITLVNGPPPIDPVPGPYPKYLDLLAYANIDRTTFVDNGTVTDEVVRIKNVLGAMGTAYSGSTTYDLPLSKLIAARWNQGESAFDQLAKTADSAGGVFLAGSAGELAYQNRNRRAGSPVLWTLREHVDGASWELDEARVVNTATAERSTGAKRFATDTASVLRYGVKAAELTRDVVDENELQDAAAWYVSRYKTGIPRCETVVVDATTVDPAIDPDIVGLAYAGNVGDRLLLADLPPTAPADEVDVFIEGVELNVSVDGSVVRWRSTFNVSSAVGSDAWVLEDAVSGILDSDFCVTTY